MRLFLSASGTLALLVISSACQQEQRVLRVEPEQRAIFTAAREGQIQPGGPAPATVVKNPYEGNASAIAEGERLFSWYNCAVCHGTHGGGGMGLNLMAPALTYGDAPDNIFDTIEKGRPAGMPQFGGRIPANQIWELVTYVRSLRGLEPQNSTAGRPEALQSHSEASQ